MAAQEIFSREWHKECLIFQKECASEVFAALLY